jgi:hypothetical protein
MKVKQEIKKMAKLSWIVKVQVEKTWIADGFDLTKERMIDMLQNDLQFATSNEVNAIILAKPERKTIRKIQGYK